MIIIPRKPHVDRYPERILLHKQYDAESLEFDIALIKMDPVKVTSHIKPIELPDPTDCRGMRKKKRRKGGKRKDKKTRQKQVGTMERGVNRKSDVRIKRSSRPTRKRSEEEDEEDGSGEEEEDGSGSGEGEHCSIEEEQSQRISW